MRLFKTKIPELLCRNPKFTMVGVQSGQNPMAICLGWEEERTEYKNYFSCSENGKLYRKTKDNFEVVEVQSLDELIKSFEDGDNGKG